MADADGDVAMSTGVPTKGGPDQVDENLYSRQLYVMGHEAMKQMQEATVLLCGVNGLGIEIAKNVILAGIKSLTICDNTVVTMRDLSSQFYLSEADAKSGTTRATACFNSLKDLNPYVSVNLLDKPLSADLVSSGQWQLVVMVGAPLSVQIEYNKACHDKGIKFISTEACGVFGSVFVDFGDAFTVKDQTGEQPLSGMVTHISQGKPGIITVHEDARHGLETGDYVTFEEIEGMKELNGCEAIPVVVKSPFTFEIEDTSQFGEYSGEGQFFQVKQPTTLSFQTLDQQISQPAFLMSDFAKDPSTHHIFYQALNSFRDDKGSFPNPTSNADAQDVVERAKTIAKDTKFDEKLFWKLARCSGAVISPMCAFLGGVVGQEVLKACTGKFTPIQQLFYFDAGESLPADKVGLDQFAAQNSRYDDNIAVFGAELHQKVLDARTFLVGAGAIGCEMLKNWALMGVGCGKDGQIFVTDMDSIETSNLNRQFLFRSKDVGSPKSTTAAVAATAMNPDLHITAQENRVGGDSEHIYNDEFWSSLNIVCNALDNVDARLYVDAQCVNYKKPLLESGTLGTKGNTQTVVPNTTESYGSTRDPPEKDIPICTLKNFPNKIHHTIQWARDDFEGAFNQAPADANSFLSEQDYLTKLSKESSSELSTLERLKSTLVSDKPLKFEDCVAWARIKFEVEYNHRIRQLLHNFPKDAVSSEGTKFWSGPKRAPEPIVFDITDETHLSYVLSAANLRAFIYGLKGTSDKAHVVAAIKAVKVPEFTAKKIKIAASDEEEKEMKDDKDEEPDYDKRVESLRKVLPDRTSLSGYRLTPIEFEKDDDSNFHMDYITACSNLRARNYTIKEATKHETKGIAGKIIPAIATTTALVTGLVALEFYKLLQFESGSEDGKTIEDFRNAYVNLALPLCTMSEPMPCGSTTIQKKGKDWEYSLWDKIEIPNGKDMRLSDLIEFFENDWGLDCQMVSYGSAILYAFFHPPSKQQKRKAAKLRKLVEAVTKTKLPEGKKYLLFEVGLCDAEDEDVEVPTIRVDISS